MISRLVWVEWFARQAWRSIRPALCLVALVALAGCTYGGFSLTGLGSGSYDSARMHVDMDATRTTRNAVDTVTTFTSKTSAVPDVRATLTRPAANVAVLTVQGRLQ